MTDQLSESQATESESSGSLAESMSGDLGERSTSGQAKEAQQKEAVLERSGGEQEVSIFAGKMGEDESGGKSEELSEESKQEPRAPEEYDEFNVPDFFKLEGQELTDFKSFAKEQDLTQEQAQKVLDFAGPKIKAMIEQPYRAWNELQIKWQGEVKSDPEIGGTKFEQSVKEAGNVFVPSEWNPFVTSVAEAKSLREALNATGAGNNPAMVRLFVKMGRLLAEPMHLTGKPALQRRQDSLLNSMYPTMGDG